MSATTSDARRRYHAASREIGDIGAHLRIVSDHNARGDLLDRQADLTMQIACVIEDAYGHDPDPNEIQAIRDLPPTADLLRTVADTERAVPIRARLTVGAFLLAFWRDGTTQAEFMLWCDLASTSDRTTRADLLDRIRPYLADRLGSGVADTLTDLADAERVLAAASPGRAFRRFLIHVLTWRSR